MSFYIIIYFFTILLSFFIGCTVFKKYLNISGLFFFIFCISIGLWFGIYFLTFFSTSNIELLLLYSKSTFGISIIGLYSFLLFIYFFNKKNIKFIIKKILFIFLLYALILYIYIGTPLIIDDLYFNYKIGDYYEIEGLFYSVHIAFSLLFFPLLFVISFYKLKKISYINRERFKYILFGIILFIGLSLIFQLLLPLFEIRLFEKGVIFFIMPFLFFTWYAISKYHFTDVAFRRGEIATFIISLLTTVIIFVLFKFYYLSIGNGFINYWGLNNAFSYIDLIFGIIIFSILNKVIGKYIPGNIEYDKFIFELNKFRERIPFITNIYDLNYFLKNEVKSKFNIKYVKIKLKTDNDSEVYNFFIRNLNANIFINDIVFIEENKNKFDKKKILKEVNKNINIIFPMFNNKGELIATFELGKKILKEQYYSEEIIIIKEFVGFLVGHMKYINIYSEINDLNINLDKKVDDKTIEYNNLISKQREFISMSSHEIKTPVTSASLQVENFLDDIESGDYDKKYLLEETRILKDQIFKISDLVKNIFSVQRYEITDVELYLEKVRLLDIIIGEYDILYRIYPNIKFDIIISKEIGFIDIDKIQFTQVLSNLLNNAIKFVDKNNPEIKISANIKNNNILIVIEDNGVGFNSGEEKNIFEKYSTGKGRSVGIGMGLYLCKKIIELHGGNISAHKSSKLGGAKFEILIPKIKE